MLSLDAILDTGCRGEAGTVGVEYEGASPTKPFVLSSEACRNLAGERGDEVGGTGAGL